MKVEKLLHQGKWLTKRQLQQKLPDLMVALNVMEAITSQGGRINPGGYWWPYTYSTGLKHNSPSSFYAVLMFFDITNIQHITIGIG